MYRLFIKVVTYLILITLLSQDILLAEGNTLLAPDSKDDLEEVIPLLSENPDAWGRFTGARKPKKPMRFPSGISREKLETFCNKYGNFGVVEGIIGTEKEFIYSAEVSDKIKRLIERFNRFIPQLTHLPPDILVKLTSEARHPILYHKEDNVLEIHALLLTPEVDDMTLAFVLHHEERHCLIDGLEPWWEELLNIYIDIVYLQQVGNADNIVNTLRILEGEHGYWRLLARRNEAFGNEVQQRQYLIDVIKHIWNFHPTLHPPSEKFDGVVTSERIFELLELEIQRRFGPLMTLWNLACISQPAAPASPMQYLSLMAQAVLTDLSLFKRWIKTEEDIYLEIELADDPMDIDSLEIDAVWAGVIVKRLWMNNKIEVVLYAPDKRCYFSKDKIKEWLKDNRLAGGYDSANGKVVYIPIEKKEEKWAKGYMEEGISGLLWETFIREYKVKRRGLIDRELQELPENRKIELEAKREKEFSREITILEHLYRDLPPEIVVKNLELALEMLEVDIDFLAICAVLLLGVYKPGLDKFSDLERQGLKNIIEGSGRIQNLPFFPLTGSRRAIQNYMNLLIQLSVDSQGRPDHRVLLHSILKKLQGLKGMVTEPRLYEGLSGIDKEYLEQEIFRVYVPLAEFLGLDDIADRFRDMWFRITNRSEYERIKEEVVEALGFSSPKVYEDLEGLLGDVRDEIERELSNLGIEGIEVVMARVKSICSIWEKLQKKRDEYPTVESVQDLLGIQVVFPDSETYNENVERIHNILIKVFDKITKLEHKSPERYGYTEYDFIGNTQDGLRIEFQIYPSRRDYQIYRAGHKAHWVYKLKRAYPEQEFDIKLLERIQGRLTGNFIDDFYTIYNGLSPWIFAGTVIKDKRDRGKEKIYIVRLPRDAIDADLASARGINELDRDFLGIKDVTDVRLTEGRLELPPAQQWASELRPGVFIIAKGRDPQEAKGRDRFSDIKRRSKRLRTYLLISLLELSKGDIEERGKGLLINALKQLGYPPNFLSSQREGELIFSIAKGLGLANTSEFYKLLYLINQAGEGLGYSRVYQQLIDGLTGESPSEVIDNDRKAERKLEEFGVRVKKAADPRILLLSYIIAAQIRGKEILHRKGLFYTNKDVQDRLGLLLPEFGLSDLEQLYTRIGMYPEFIYSILLRYPVVSIPAIEFEIDEDKSRIYSRVFEIMDMEDIRRETPIERGNKVVIPFYPPRLFTVSTIGRILDAVRRIHGIGSVEYKSGKIGDLVERRVVVAVNQRDKNRLIGIIADLMGRFDISISLGEGRSRGKTIEQEFVVRVPEQIPMDVLKEAIHNEMGRKGIKGSVVDNVSGSLKGGFALPVFGWDEYIAYIGLGIIFIYVSWRIFRYIWHRIEDSRLNEKIGWLFNLWQEYDRKPVEETNLLDPFYEEPRDVPWGSELKDIIQRIEIRRIEKVITKHSDMAYYNPDTGVDLRYDTQGYKVLGLYKGRLYRLLIVGEKCQGIGYDPSGKESDVYLPLGGEITNACKVVLLQKIQEYIETRKGRIPPVRRLVIVPMQGRTEFERFSRDSIFSRSILERFPDTTQHPSFVYGRYILIPDDSGLIAHYMPMDKSGRGFIGRSMFKLSGGIDALHEIVHAIYDYNGGLQKKVTEYFTRNPNETLEEAIASGYGYSLEDEDDRRYIINEAFAYTLSEFAGMTRPLYDVEGIGDIRKRLELRTVEETNDRLMKMIGDAIAVHGHTDERLNNIMARSVKVWNDYRRKNIQESRARQEYFELVKELMNLVLLPPIRLMDVRFFAENGLIEPWMNPLELGYTKEELGEDVDTEYYLRVIEFLIERSLTQEPYYKLFSTGRWVSAPFGQDALDEARRLGWVLIKTNYGINSLNDIESYDMDKFRTAPGVLGIIERIIRAEDGLGIYKKLIKDRATREERYWVLEKFKRQINGLKAEGEDVVNLLRTKANESAASGMKYLTSENPWVMQEFFEEAVLNRPGVLLLDVKTLQGMDEKTSRGLVRLINQVSGRVAVFSSAKMNDAELEAEIYDFWQRNIKWFSSKVKKRLMDVYDNIYICGDESSSEFVDWVYRGVQRRFKAAPEDIMIFTSKNEFVRLWRRLAAKSLFYILDNNNLYITSESLLAIQALVGEDRFDIQPGETIELLPEYYYTPAALEELERREAEQGA